MVSFEVILILLGLFILLRIFLEISGLLARLALLVIGACLLLLALWNTLFT